MLGLVLGLAAAGPAGPAGAPPAATPRPPTVSSGAAAAGTPATPATPAGLAAPAAAPAHAEEIVAELAAVLSRLGATDPIQGTLELQLSRQSSEEHWTDQSRVTVEVEDGPQGFTMSLSRAGSRQALHELRAQILDPAKHTPTYNALQALNLNELSGDLDGAAALAQDLSLAHAVDVQASSYLGRPARLLVLSLPPRLSAEARKHVKTADSQLSVWIGADGMPVGAEKVEHTRGRFLVLYFENLRKQSWTFGHKGNRLFATRHELVDNASGLGQDFRSSSVATLTLR